MALDRVSARRTRLTRDREQQGPRHGRVFLEGEAEPYTGVPGVMKRDHMDRVLRAPKAGLVRPVRAIGDIVKKGT